MGAIDKHSTESQSQIQQLNEALCCVYVCVSVWACVLVVYFLCITDCVCVFMQSHTHAMCFDMCVNSQTGMVYVCQRLNHRGSLSPPVRPPHSDSPLQKLFNVDPAQLRKPNPTASKYPDWPDIINHAPAYRFNTEPSHSSPSVCIHPLIHHQPQITFNDVIMPRHMLHITVRCI